MQRYKEQTAYGMELIKHIKQHEAELLSRSC